MYDIKIQIKDPSGAEHSIDLSTRPEPTSHALSVAIADELAPATKRPIKIGADGSQLPDTATNHVAVLDPRTSLMWAVESLGGARGVKQKDAAAQLNGFALLGHSDWRVPEIEELQTLVNFKAVNPSIDADLFPGTKSDWYWTNTAYAPSPSGYAWYVSFTYGYSDFDDRDDDDGFVRAVRSVAPSGQ